MIAANPHGTMRKIYVKVDTFIKREWFLLITLSAIAILVVLFEVY